MMILQSYSMRFYLGSGHDVWRCVNSEIFFSLCSLLLIAFCGIAVVVIFWIQRKFNITTFDCRTMFILGIVVVPRAYAKKKGYTFSNMRVIHVLGPC